MLFTFLLQLREPRDRNADRHAQIHCQWQRREIHQVVWFKTQFVTTRLLSLQDSYTHMA